EEALVEPRQAGVRGGLGDRSSGTPEGAGGLTNGPVPGSKPPPSPPRLVAEQLNSFITKHHLITRSAGYCWGVPVGSAAFGGLAVIL
ncbi:hypothetical protein TYRP_019034, partial [Tyrophagus putrescentiae]